MNDEGLKSVDMNLVSHQVSFCSLPPPNPPFFLLSLPFLSPLFVKMAQSYWRWKGQMFRFCHRRDAAGCAGAQLQRQHSELQFLCHKRITTAPPQPAPPHPNLPKSIFCLASLMKLHIFCQIIPTTSRHNLVLQVFWGTSLEMRDKKLNGNFRVLQSPCWPEGMLHKPTGFISNVWLRESFFKRPRLAR